MIENDTALELEAVKAYNKVIALAADLGDESTADYLVAILTEEEGHVDWGEKQLVQIEQMGIENYLAKMGSEE
jgi:bacterioferritin